MQEKRSRTSRDCNVQITLSADRQGFQINYLKCRYTKTDLVFGFSKNQILVAVIPGQKAPRTFPGQKAPRTLLGQNGFWIIAKNHFEMSITHDRQSVM